MTHSNEIPAKIQQLGLSLFAYNYDIKTYISESTEMQPAAQGYEYESYLFKHKPTAYECINRIITDKYPDGAENAIQRKGIIDKENPEFLEYCSFVEELKLKVKSDFAE